MALLRFSPESASIVQRKESILSEAAVKLHEPYEVHLPCYSARCLRRGFRAGDASGRNRLRPEKLRLRSMRHEGGFSITVPESSRDCPAFFARKYRLGPTRTQSYTPRSQAQIMRTLESLSPRRSGRWKKCTVNPKRKSIPEKRPMATRISLMNIRLPSHSRRGSASLTSNCPRQSPTSCSRHEMKRAIARIFRLSTR